MQYTPQSFKDAVAENIISAEQADKLLAFLKTHPDTRPNTITGSHPDSQENTYPNTNSHIAPSFNFTHVLYYFGGLIAIAAMTLFMNLGWESFGGWGIVCISLIYATLGLKLSHNFKQKGLSIPAGICATFVVALSPLAIYGLQQGMGWWPDDSNYQDYHRYVKWHWLYMEAGTLIVGSIMARHFKYPFLIMPIAVTLWYLSMDITAIISGDSFSWELRKLVSMYCGLLMIGLAVWVDIRARYQADYAFWIYIFGVIAFWGGMTLQQSDSELSKFIYLCINLVMIGTGILLVRRVFAIFGAIGCCLYLGHLAEDIFKDSWLFPISLTFIGLGIVYLGVLWQKHEKEITQKMRALLPLALRELLESKEQGFTNKL
ncbi:hypothetical protein [Dasania marina]|uniref:hypothetical protein n=1 Tax=Dasania marina TaxID=471499 RepID=UPI00036B9E8D|nr:hypothetical protein [Dasania marina]